VQQRWGGWGIPIFSAWALVLALVSLARLLLLSKAVELAGDRVGSPAQIWLVMGLNTAFALLFGAAAFGLWTRQNWGRLLFLYTIVGWGAFIVIALFVSNPADSTTAIVYEGLRAVVGVTISMWYFNLPHIKQLFSPTSQQ